MRHREERRLDEGKAAAAAAAHKSHKSQALRVVFNEKYPEMNIPKFGALTLENSGETTVLWIIYDYILMILDKNIGSQ